MKKLILASVFAFGATQAFAGNPLPVDDIVVEPPLIEDDTRGSSAGVVVPLIILAVVLAAIAD